MAQFLARAWSDKPDVIVKLDVKAEVPEAFESLYRRRARGIIMPPPSRFPATELISAYRLWRASLWHEAMHHYYGILKNFESSVPHSLVDLIEDYRVEYLGVKEYPGMVRELDLRKAVYYHLASPPGDVLAMYQQLLLLGAVKGLKPEEIPENVVKAAKYTEEAIRAGASSIEVAERVRQMLDLEREYREGRLASLKPAVDFPVPPTSSKKLKSKEMRKAVEEWVKAEEEFEELKEGKPKDEETLSKEKKTETGQGGESRGPERKDGEERAKKSRVELAKRVEELLKPPVEVIEELEQIEIENEKIVGGREGAAAEVEGGVTLPSKLDVDESPYYDVELITHLKGQLRRLRRKWVEIPSTSGELDVDSYVARYRKFFVDEERLKVGGFRVLILVDHSGSIHEYQVKYKKACIALAEALNALGIPFAIYAFAGSRYKLGVVNIYLVKGFGERWTRMNAKRLAQIEAEGGTPLGTIYSRLERVARSRGETYFITLTDGEPHTGHETLLCQRMIRELKRSCRMIAIAMGHSVESAVRLANKLGYLGYDRYVALDDVRKLPEKVLKLLGE